MEIRADMVISCAALVLIPSVFYILAGMVGLRVIPKKIRKRRRQTLMNGSSTHPTSNDPEVIIVGSGILGSAMAAVLARDGRKVTVIERDMSEPDRIVGEIMQPGGLRALRELGLGDCASGFGEYRMDGFVVHDPFTKKPLDFQLPKDESGRINSCTCFHHGRFVMSLRKAAMAEKNVTYIEGTVTSVVEEKGRIVGVEYKKKGEQEKQTLRAPLTVIADGTFSKFRKQFSTTDHEKATTPTSYFIGFKMKETESFKPHHAEGMWCQHYPTMLYRIADDTLRFLVEIKTSVQPKNPKQFVVDTICPELPEHIRKIVEKYMAQESPRIRLVPTYYVPSAPIQTPGVLMLGDALSTRSPWTANGMTFALKDLKNWAEILEGVDSLDDDEVMAEALDEFQKYRRSYALASSVMAQAIYEVLTAKDSKLTKVGWLPHFAGGYLSKFRLGGYNYVLLGGECLNGPLRIYAALEPRPSLLLWHFFACNLYTVYYLLKSAPWYAKPIALLDGPLVFLRSSYLFFSLWLNECKSVGKSR